MNMHHSMRRLGSLLIAMQLIVACSNTPPKVQESVEAFSAFTAKRAERDASRHGTFLPSEMEVEERGDYMVIKVTKYFLSVIYGMDDSPIPKIDPDSFDTKIYRSEETGPMLFVYRDGKLYAACEHARICAPEMEYFELPQGAEEK